MHLFTFEPGDGVSYRVLFGRLPSPSSHIPHYVVFGFGEYGDALITVVFDTEHVSEIVFRRVWDTAQHTHTVAVSGAMTDYAHAVYAAIVGAKGYSIADWAPDWRERIPVAVRS